MKDPDAMRNSTGVLEGGGQLPRSIWGPHNVCIYVEGERASVPNNLFYNIHNCYEALLSTDDWSNHFHRTILFLFAFW